MKIITYTDTSGEEVTGKFIQLVWCSQEYLVFAPFSLCRFHVQILQRFLDEQGIPYKKLNEEHLLVKESAFNMIGGGRFRFNPTAKTLSLYDNSQAFGRFEAKELCEKIAKCVHDWRYLAVSIS